MDAKEKVGKTVFDLAEGVRPVHRSVIEQYERKMKDEVIPDIVRTVEKRRLFAAESRLKQLKQPFDLSDSHSLGLRSRS